MGEGLPSKRFMVVSAMVVVGIFLILIGLGMLPTRWGTYNPPIAGLPELGALVIVLALVVALLWRTATLK